MTNEILEYLNRKEKELGIKEVRESCRKYMLKKTYAGYENIKRKPINKAWTVDAWAKQGGICPRCKEKIEYNDMSGDHITSLAKGGKHSKWNIQCLHKKCNSAKGANDMMRESKLQQVGKTTYSQIEIED
jgi:5-methylcytosine-specific restriction endonuclease McrA